MQAPPFSGRAKGTLRFGRLYSAKFQSGDARASLRVAEAKAAAQCSACVRSKLTS